MKTLAPTTSLWLSEEIPLRPALDKNATVDVCVVGAGIASLTAACLLATEGRSVLVVDDGPIAGGETSRTTAHLVNALDNRYFQWEKLHGHRGAKLAAESHTAAIHRIEEIVAKEKIVPPGEPPMSSTRNWRRRIALG